MKHFFEEKEKKKKMTPSPVTMAASVALYQPVVDKNNSSNNTMNMTPYGNNAMNHRSGNNAMEATPPHQFYAPNTKGLLNAPGQNNCFLNSAVQVRIRQRQRQRWRPLPTSTFLGRDLYRSFFRDARNAHRVRVHGPARVEEEDSNRINMNALYKKKTKNEGEQEKCYFLLVTELKRRAQRLRAQLDEALSTESWQTVSCLSRRSRLLGADPAFYFPMEIEK